MTTKTTVQEQLDARREEMQEHEAKSAEAARLANELEPLCTELKEVQKRHDQLAGRDRLEHVVTANIIGVGSVAFGPLQSVKTGDELAKQLAPRLEAIQSEIQRREGEIERLLARPE